MRIRSKVLTMDVDVINLTDAVEEVRRLSQLNRGAYVCVSNVHMCMEVFDCDSFRDIVNDADLVLADGKPISWAQRGLGFRGAAQVRGQDIMNALCGLTGEKSLRIGLYGGSSEALLSQVIDKLQITYPDISIDYHYAPPFRPLTDEEDVKVIKAINDANIDVLFVGIGCPKQERWMAEHREHLNCVMLGVGAAFDFIAGSKKHAPKWMQKIGLEWLFRLLSEPRRLWRRYLNTNPRFIWFFAKQWLRRRSIETN